MLTVSLECGTKDAILKRLSPETVTRSTPAHERMDRLLKAARGDIPSDLVLTNGLIINVFSGQIERGNVAIIDGMIAGVGEGYGGRERIDVAGAYVAPGLIDAHVHIESSMCVPAEFASAIVPRGITAAVVDPHEIANVAGMAGVRFIAEASRGLSLEVIVMAPSCVPATPMATAGATLTPADIAQLRAEGVVWGLAEVMNFPGVIAGSDDTRQKISAMAGRPVDGHCPGVTGKALNAYIAAGVGSDHESVRRREAEEKLSRGLYLLIREATNAHNLDALLPFITPANSRRICFCSDDRTPVDLLKSGSIDNMVRRAIVAGIDPVEAFRMATLNPAEWFGLSHLGAIAPGRAANLMVFDDLKRPTAHMVFAKGRLVARDGRLLNGIAARPASPPLGQCRVRLEAGDLRIEHKSDLIRVIGSVSSQLVTEHLRLPPRVVDGGVESDTNADVLKMAVIDRHGVSGNVGIGFIRGFGLRRGAIAGTVAHDHHNLVIIGVDDASMLAAANAVVAMGGGLAVTAGEQILARLALPVGGLMSDRPIEEVAAGYEALLAAAGELGAVMEDSFMAMSFMALEVIPSLKLTDQGLVDVDRFERVPLFI